MKKYYLDSCVWISALSEKDENHSISLELLEKITREKTVITVTSRRIKEMKNKGWYAQYERLKNDLYRKGNCFGASETEEDKQIALRHNEYLKLGFDDCLHMQMAKKLKATPVSFDRHWQEIGAVIGTRVYKPDELL